jgi:nitrite reductase (NADH) large subunit
MDKKIYENNTKAADPLAKKYVIVGAGIAGVSAAEAIRKSDPAGVITLLSNEDKLPYFRMNLTRYLAGEIDDSRLDLHPLNWYSQNNINLHLNTTVVDILTQDKEVVLADGETVPYDILILAAGASPFIPPFPGTGLEGVQTLRTMQDANMILDACCQPVHVVCIGGGLLGLEVAGAIAHRGASVTVIESLQWLLPRQLDQTASRILTQKIEAMGIKIIAGAKTKALIGNQHVQQVVLEDGRQLQADMVVISAGVSANLDLAYKAGLRVNRGIVVDEHMHTSQVDIYAAGDETEYGGTMYGLWVPAKSQGVIAGQCAAGKDASFKGIPPSAKLKVLGIDLFSIGQFTPADETYTVLSEEKNGNYASFVFHEGILVGSILLGDARLSGLVKQAIETQINYNLHLQKSITASDFMGLLQS